MPNVGGVFIPDNLMPGISAEPEERPGYGSLLASAAKSTFNQIRYGVPLDLATIAGASADTRKSLEDGLKASQVAQGPAPATVSDLTSGRVGFGRFAAENLIGSLPAMAGSLVGGIAGGIRGGEGGAIAGAVLGGVPTFVGSNVDRAVQENGRLSDAAATRSLAVAPLQAASDVLGERYLPGVGKIFGDFAATQAGGFLRRTATSMAKAGAVEAVTEASQQVGERYAAGKPLTTPDAVREYVNAGVTAFAVGGILGAGGGFRHTEATTKPAAEVTPADLTAHIDQILALPAPPDITTDSSGTSRVNPSGTIQLGLPSPDQFKTPDAYTDTTGTTVVAPQGPADLMIERNKPTVLENTYDGNLTPEMRALLQTGMPEAPNVPLTASTALARGLPAVEGFEAAPAVTLEPEASRPFKDAPIESVVDASKNTSKNAETQQTYAAREIEARLAEATGAKPLTTDNFQQRVDEAKHGLRGGFVQAVTAADPKELLGKVYDQVFTEQDTRANTTKFAQRLGILDENLQPTPLAQQIETEKAAGVANAIDEAQQAPAPTAPVEGPKPAAAADPAFGDEWKQTLKDAGIQRISTAKGLENPTSLLSAQQRVVTMLGTDERQGDKGISQVEKLARTMGLVTDDDAMDITPLGRKTFLTTSQGTEAAVSAAQAQGYTGAAASMFDRGVQAVVAGKAPETQFSSVSDMAAHEAGKVWAEDFVKNGDTKTAAQTAGIMARQDPREVGQAVDRKAAAERRQLSPAQVQQQANNNLLNAADLRTVNDSDQAALRRMVREGATAEEIGTALQKVQGGQTLFKEASPAAAVAPNATVDRGQPVFREMNTGNEAPAKAKMRVESEAAVAAYQARQQIEEAKAAGTITEARAAKLHSLVDDGKVAQAQKLTQSAKLSSEKPGLVGEHDAAFEQAITGKSFLDIAQHMLTTAPSLYHREVMLKVRTAAQMLEKQGMTFDVKILHPGDAAPSMVNEAGTSALTYIRYNPDANATIYLKGPDMGAHGIINQQVVAHEMLHAVTMSLMAYGNNPEVYGKTHLGKAVAAMTDLQRAIANHFLERHKEGNLNDFERRFLEGDNNSLHDMDELLAWGLTNPEMQRYLNSIEYKPRQSVFSRMVELVRGLLGMQPRYDSVLAELLRTSERIFATPRQEFEAMLPRNRPDGFDVQPAQAAMSDSATSAGNRTVEAANEATKGVAAMADKVVDSLKATDIAAKARPKVLGWLSLNQIVRSYGDKVAGITAYRDAQRERGAILARVEKMGVDAYQDFEKFERADPGMAKRLGQLMEIATKYQIDPDKAWSEHAHHGADPKLSQETAQIRSMHEAAVKLRNDLSRGDGAGKKLYDRLKALNESQNYMHMAARLHRLVTGDRELMLGVENALVNPVDSFMRESGGLTAAQDIRDFWAKALDDQVAAVTAFIREKKGEAERSGVASDMAALREHLSPIELQLGSIQEAKNAIARGPYFHLGRFGDHFASATITKGEDGKANPKSLAAVAKVLDEGKFGTAQIATDETRPKFSIRFEKKDQADRFAVALSELQKQGHIEEGTALVGPRALAGNYGTQEGLPQFVTALLQRVEDSPRYAEDAGMTPEQKGELQALKESVKQDIRDQWLESQPDNAISKVLTKRYAVPGYDSDMMRSFAHRWHVGASHIANTATAPKFDRAAASLEAQYQDELHVDRQDAQGNPIPRGDPDTVLDITRELRLRDAKSPINETANGFDTVRAATNAYFLGMSPAYGLINLSQIGVTALPELAKKNGYMQSFHAMRRALAPAIAIVRAVGSEAHALGWKHYGDVAITDGVLRKAGLDDKTRGFITNMLATGTIDIGSMARSLGRIADRGGTGGALDTGLKLGSAIGLYTETFSRLIVALAARDLHGDYSDAAHSYASHVVSEAMFDYQSGNTARLLGKKGVLGPVTPFLAQFMSYQVQLTEKLYSEFHDAVGKQRPGESAESATARRAESAKFLAGHLTAITALAGTLGLPFATVFASVIERMVDKFGSSDEPYDATAAWRNFLAGILGKDAAEVVARGVPRAFGFDVSSRAGEQNLLPMSEFLTDRRPWQESVNATAGRSLGAAPSMLSNIITGGGKIADGDVLEGMKEMLPVAFKSPLEVYRMSTDGYMDTKGNKLPMTPKASSYLWQLLGFTPEARAEYSEARGDQQSRRGEIARTAGALRSQIVGAVLANDTETVHKLVAKAQKFDQDNPAYAITHSLAGAVSGEIMQRQQAKALGTPLGVPMKDVAGRHLTQYANFN